MTNNIIISSRPFGYNSAKELYDNYVSKKYEKLKETTDINDYYDYIFGCGALMYWIERDKEKKKTILDNYFYQMLRAIYNNTKHFELNRKQYNIKLIEYGRTNFETNMEGDCIWDDNAIWDDDCYWYDNIKGESDQMKLVCSCKIIDKGINNYFLYEVCKETNILIKTILEYE